VDAHSRQRPAPLAGQSLAGAYGPGASTRVGALDADRSLGTVGTKVKFTTVGAPKLHVTETTGDASRRSQVA
jgi:hypothetical protein